MSGNYLHVLPYFTNVPNGNLGKYARELPKKLDDDFAEAMQLLLNPEFQDLLVNCPRAKRTFTLAIDATDTVSSTWLIRGEDGREYKPEDYLDGVPPLSLIA